MVPPYLPHRLNRKSQSAPEWAHFNTLLGRLGSHRLTEWSSFTRLGSSWESSTVDGSEDVVVDDAESLVDFWYERPGTDLESARLNVLGNVLSRVVSLRSGSSGDDAMVNERKTPRVSGSGAGAARI